jgi:hypothetical protein
VIKEKRETLVERQEPQDPKGQLDHKEQQDLKEQLEKEGLLVG